MLLDCCCCSPLSCLSAWCACVYECLCDAMATNAWPVVAVRQHCECWAFVESKGNWVKVWGNVLLSVFFFIHLRCIHSLRSFLWINRIVLIFFNVTLRIMRIRGMAEGRLNVIAAEQCEEIDVEKVIEKFSESSIQGPSEWWEFDRNRRTLTMKAVTMICIMIQY